MPSLSTRESTPDLLVCSLITVWVCATLCFLTEVHVCEKEIDRSLEIMGRSCHIRSPRTHRLLFITLANALAAAKVKCAACCCCGFLCATRIFTWALSQRPNALQKPRLPFCSSHTIIRRDLLSFCLPPALLLHVTCVFWTAFFCSQYDSITILFYCQSTWQKLNLLKCSYYAIFNITFHAVCNEAVRECKRSAKL